MPAQENDEKNFTAINIFAARVIIVGGASSLLRDFINSRTSHIWR
jgi:hypothetical protein